MTYTTWGELRDHLITAFGDTPHPATEQDIIDAYELHPGAIEKAASETIAAVNTGSIRSGWGVLRKKAEKITTPVANPTRSSSVDREKRINRAEQWLRNAGLHYDSETEILLELFDGGLLSAYAQISLYDRRTDEQGLDTGASPERDALHDLPHMRSPTRTEDRDQAGKRADDPRVQDHLPKRASAAVAGPRWALTEPPR